MTPPDPCAIRLSTAAVLERDRLAVWREVFGRTIIRLDIEPEDKAAFHADGMMHLLPGIAFASVAATPFRVSRTSQLIQQDANDSVILVTASAPVAVRQGRRDIVLAKGDAVFLRGGEPCRIEASAPADYVNIAADATALAPLLPALDDIAMAAVPARNDLLGLLLGYLDLLRAGSVTLTEPVRAVAADHIRDLLAAIAGTHPEAARVGIGAARLRAIKADIEDRLSAPALSVDEIAARHGVSPRYIRRLFQEERTTFSDFVLGRRLDRARAMLRRAAYARQTIAAIAYDVGFGDLSYFNRTFRRRFGATPSEVRHETAIP